jgi:hypothetical protein
VPPSENPEQWMTALREAYRQGAVRDEDLLLDPAYADERRKFVLGEVLRVRRGF